MIKQDNCMVPFTHIYDKELFKQIVCEEREIAYYDYWFKWNERNVERVVYTKAESNCIKV